MQEKDCLFCKIQRREITALIVYEDDKCFAMMDIYPAQYGHVLVIPNQHYPNYMETDSEILGHLTKIAQKIAVAQERAFGNAGNKLVINCKPEGNQKIFHTHLHILPFYAKGCEPVKESLEAQAEKLSRELN